MLVSLRQKNKLALIVELSECEKQKRIALFLSQMATTTKLYSIVSK